MKPKNITLKINKKLPGHEAGTTVVIQVDNKSTPTKRFWRDRLRDAEVDNCVEIVKLKQAPKKVIPSEENK